VEFEDGRTEELGFVYVSAPIDAGFFAYDIRDERRRAPQTTERARPAGRRRSSDRTGDDLSPPARPNSAGDRSSGAPHASSRAGTCTEQAAPGRASTRRVGYRWGERCRPLRRPLGGRGRLAVRREVGHVCLLPDGGRWCARVGTLGRLCTDRRPALPRPANAVRRLRGPGLLWSPLARPPRLAQRRRGRLHGGRDAVLRGSRRGAGSRPLCPLRQGAAAAKAQRRSPRPGARA